MGHALVAPRLYGVLPLWHLVFAASCPCGGLPLWPRAFMASSPGLLVRSSFGGVAWFLGEVAWSSGEVAWSFGEVAWSYGEVA